MGLGTVRSRLSAGCHEEHDQCLRDVQLVWDNALQFNHAVHKAVLKLRDEFSLDCGRTSWLARRSARRVSRACCARVPWPCSCHFEKEEALIAAALIKQERRLSLVIDDGSEVSPALSPLPFLPPESLAACLQKRPADNVIAKTPAVLIDGMTVLIE